MDVVLEKNKNRTYFILFVLLSFSLIFHLFGCFYLYDFMNDEGAWLINAKNYVEFRDFSLEGVYQTALSPLNTFLHIPLFIIFGPSIWISRYVSIIFTLVMLILFYKIANRNYGLKISSFALFVITVNGIFNRYTTWATLESKIYFFQILTLWCIFSSKRWLRNIAFLPLGLGFAFKPTIIPFIIALSYAVFAMPEQESAIQDNTWYKKLKDMTIFLFLTFAIGGMFFYIAYLIDPENFLLWGIKKVIGRRFTIFYILHDPLHSPLLNVPRYFFQRAPVTFILSAAGFIWAFLEKSKTRFEKFLLSWVFVELFFFIFQRSVAERYILDLIFPCSIFSGRLIFNYLFAKRLFERLRNTLIISLVFFIALYQIGGSLYFFLILKPQRFAIETHHFLSERESFYNAILAPSQTLIGLKKKGLVTSNGLKIEDLIKNQVKFPLLCVLQEEYAEVLDEDKQFLRNHGKFIRRIGYFSVWEISKKEGIF